MSGAWASRLNPRVYKLLSTYAQPVVLGDLLAAVEEPFATKLLGYFQKLAEHRLVELTLPAGPAVPLPARKLSSPGPGAVAVA
jgi:hypothetical protein